MSLSNGAIYGWDKKNAFYFLLLESLANHYKVDIDLPYFKLPKKFKEILFYGSGDELIEIKYVKGYRSKNIDNYNIRTEVWSGIIQKLEKQYENGSYSQRERLVKYLSVDKCKACDGKRLNESSRNVFIKNKSISDITALTIENCLAFFSNLKLLGMQKEISSKIIFEIPVD